MPQALGFVLAAAGASSGIISFVTTGIGATIINALGAAALGYGATLISQALMKNDVPKAEDGKYNLKQSVPPLVRVYGRVRKGGDYDFDVSA